MELLDVILLEMYLLWTVLYIHIRIYVYTA